MLFSLNLNACVLTVVTDSPSALASQQVECVLLASSDKSTSFKAVSCFGGYQGCGVHTRAGEWTGKVYREMKPPKETDLGVV